MLYICKNRFNCVAQMICYLQFTHVSAFHFKAKGNFLHQLLLNSKPSLSTFEIIENEKVNMNMETFCEPTLEGIICLGGSTIAYSKIFAAYFGVETICGTALTIKYMIDKHHNHH